MCDPPGSGVEPVSPALASKFFTTEPAGKPLMLNIIKTCLECLGMSLNKLILTEGICIDGNLPPGLPPRLDVLNGRFDFTKYMATAWNTWEECPTAILSVKTKSKTISV